MTTPATPLETDLDLFTDEALTDPYPHYRYLRDLGPAVYLTGTTCGSWAGTATCAPP